MTIGFDLGHDLDLDFSRSNMEFAISQPKMVRLPRNEKQIVTGVTSVVGVPSTHLVLNMFSGLQVPKMSLSHFLRKQNLIFSHLLWVSSVLFLQCSILINNYSKVIMCGPIMKKNMIIIFWLQFHLIIFPNVLLTGSYIGVSLRSHYPNQWWPSSMRHIYIIQFNEL